MFIIGKKENQIDESLRVLLEDKNINSINDYLESYYKLMYQQDVIDGFKKDVKNANNNYIAECFSFFALFHFIFTPTRYIDLHDKIDYATYDLVDSKDRFAIMEESLNANYKKIMNSNMLVRIDAAKDYYSTISSELTDEDSLKDLVLNNELELIEDHLLDKVEYDLGKKYTKKNKTYRHDYYNLESRLYNVSLQYKLLNKTIENGYDVNTVYDVIDTCYEALVRGDKKFNSSRFDYLNDDIQEYIDETKKSIKSADNNKIKRR